MRSVARGFRNIVSIACKSGERLHAIMLVLYPSSAADLSGQITM
jgi:hypothetical protein